MRSRKTLVVVLVLVAVAVGVGLSLGNKLDIAKLRRAIATLTKTRLGVKPRVTCPNRTKEKKGDRFQCLVHFAVGTATVQVTQTDGKGHVHFVFLEPVVLLRIRRLDNEIATALSAKAGARIMVRCPPSVIQRQGLNFSCTASVGSQRQRVVVTQTDGAGNVRYVVR
jgi:Domain of unknown function (DUF4333)